MRHRAVGRQAPARGRREARRRLRRRGHVVGRRGDPTRRGGGRRGSACPRRGPLDWGIPTAASVALLAAQGFETIVATGGIGTGLDVARAIALGASAAGIARPVLRALSAHGRPGAVSFLDGVETELRAAMLLTGSRDVAALRRAPRVVVGELGAWISQLG